MNVGSSVNTMRVVEFARAEVRHEVLLRIRFFMTRECDITVAVGGVMFWVARSRSVAIDSRKGQGCPASCSGTVFLFLPCFVE